MLARKIRNLGAFATAAATAALVSVGTGTAATWTGTTGSPGTVSLVKTAGTGGGFENLINTGGIGVSRSPAFAGTQLVTVRFALYRWTNGVWAPYRTLDNNTYVAAGMSARFADANLTFNDYGYYRTTWQVWWRYTNGTTFAYTKAVYDGDDYQCSGWLVVNCQTGNGFIYLGT
jgi:hypothetical protein